MRIRLLVEDTQISSPITILVAYKEIYSRTAIRTFCLSFLPCLPSAQDRQLPQAITIYETPVEIGRTLAKVAICIKTAIWDFSPFFSYYLKDVNLLRCEDRIKLGMIWGVGRLNGGGKMVFYTFSRTIYEVLKLQARMKGREDRDEEDYRQKPIQFMCLEI